MREAVKELHDRRKDHEAAISEIDAVLKRLGASGVRKSRATRRGSNGAGGDRMQGAHDAMAVRRGVATPEQLKRVNNKRASRGLKPLRNGGAVAARPKPAGASLAEAVSE